MSILLKTTKSIENELFSKYTKVDRWVEKLVNMRPNSIGEILDAHKALWRDGIHEPRFSPSDFGMFRTDDIGSMSLSDVYLGNVDGIWTNSAQFFYENRKNEPEVYKRVCEQYMETLISGVKHLRNMIYDGEVSREKLEKNIVHCFNEHIDKKYPLLSLKIQNTSLAENKIVDCVIRYADRTVNTSFLNLSGRFFFPEGFKSGVSLSSSNFKSFKYLEIFRTLSPDKLIDISRLQEASKVKRGKQFAHLSRGEAKQLINYLKKKERMGCKFGI